jgi:hypothetical protein
MNPTTTTLNLSIHGQNNTGQYAIYLVFLVPSITWLLTEESGH